MALVYLHPLPFRSDIWSGFLRNGDGEAIAPDLYQLGDSLEEWAAAVVDLAGAGKHTMVGNSIGGSCAIEIALLIPTRSSASSWSGPCPVIVENRRFGRRRFKR